ncbi:DUF4041 domain-containing protein [Amphritea atlantica]|uniref:DUF4041 domain-containing protein n=1 Tax=Amphritea atlantica TaxID=355243 RepID=A0ABY5GT82_9GAMM|nr:DUF4041 domain-containing protein [Amphritea atlantica]
MDPILLGAIASIIIVILILLVLVKNQKSLKRELEKASKILEVRTKENKKLIDLLKKYKQKYSKLINADEYVKNQHQSADSYVVVQHQKADQYVAEAKKTKERFDILIDQLRKDYKNKKTIFDELVKKAAIYNDQIEVAELGFYEPHFDFDTSEQYKGKIDTIRSKQKDMVRKKSAVTCDTEWRVGNSVAEGKKFTDRIIRLALRAFNNECEAAVTSVTWKNIARLEIRIQKAFDAINKLNQTNQVEINQNYLKLKLDELRLAYEYQVKKQDEKEEQAEIKRQMREEVALQKELENTVKEELKYEKLLTKARLDAESSAGGQLEALQAKIAELDKELTAAHEKAERAKSMAQQTRSGHVYVISNIGSFGKHVYKIGMTRRLEPLDRVKELGDASVPFLFDVHVMIYSDDAPALEKSLHHSFTNKRVNMVNNRKEFFEVSLDEIKDRVAVIGKNNIEFIETAEAREYRETQSIKEKLNLSESGEIQDEIHAFPEMI